MSDFLLTFVEVIGAFAWLITFATLLVTGFHEARPRRAALLIGAAIFMAVLGVTFEIYGLDHWWLK